MAGKKRKAVVEDSEPPASRRQSGRARKTGLKYNETPDATDVDSGSDFNDDHDDDVVEEEPKSKKSKVNKNAKPSKNTKPSNTKQRKLEVSKHDSETDEEELKREGWTKTNGKWEMVVELPGEKDPGDTPYEDQRIHPNTMEFLGELKENNQRDWLKLHDAPFRQAERDFQTFVKTLSERIYEIDATIPELPLKDVIYRIYRDLRFTNDPTPYKPYFSAVWSRAGRKGPYALYYIQIQPGDESFVGGGYYAPDNTTLACIREDIDQQPHQFKSVLMNKKIRKAFFPGVKDKDEKKIVEAFCGMSSVNALKMKPKDYAKDHPDIELLKLRSFLLHKKISDDEVTGSKILDIVAGLFDAIEPFVTYLNDVVLPDV